MPSPLAIPAATAAPVSVEQSAPDPVHFDAIVAGFDDTYVVSGGTVTQRGAGANLSVDAAAAVVVSQGVVLSTSLTNLAVTPDVSNPRWALVYVTSGGTPTITHGTAAATSPLIPAIPTGAVALAAVWVPANAASIVNNDIQGMAIVKTAPDGVYSGAAGSAALTNYGRTALEATAGTDVAAGQFTDSAAGDTIFRSAAGTLRLGVGAAGAAASKLRVTSTAVTVAASTDLVVGTKATKGGTLALTAAGNTATVLGEFSSANLSLEMRLHVTLITGLTSRSKAYEFQSGTNADVSGVYYKLLPADASAGQDVASDFFLVSFRPAANPTKCQFWVCTSSTFASTGAVTWMAETYSDAVVTYASTLTGGTAAPALPFVVDSTHKSPHPSNVLGVFGPSVGLAQVGIGTDTPAGGSLLDVHDPVSAIALASVTGASAVQLDLGAINTAGSYMTGTAAGDSYVQSLNAGTALYLNKRARVTNTDLEIYDGSAFHAAPRARMISVSTATSITTISSTVTESPYTAMASTNVQFTAVTGRRYRIYFSSLAAITTLGTANDNFLFRIRDGGASAPVAGSSTLLWEGTVNAPAANKAQNISAMIEVTCVASGAGANQINAGVNSLGVFGIVGSGSTWTMGSTTAGRISMIAVDDVGT